MAIGSTQIFEVHGRGRKDSLGRLYKNKTIKGMGDLLFGFISSFPYAFGMCSFKRIWGRVLS